MRTAVALSLLGFSSMSGLCQQTTNQPSFDIADVHVSPRSDWVKAPSRAFQGGYLAGDRYELRRATMLDLIRTAYDVDAEKVSGGPSWLDYDRYEVSAWTKRGMRPEALRLMLQKLLEERFKLVVKPDTEEVPGYTLKKSGRELKLKEAAPASPAAGCQNMGADLSGPTPQGRLQCRNATLAVFARTIQGLVSNPFHKYPVLDSTGLEGGWDIDFQYPLRMSADSQAGITVIVPQLSAGLVEALDKIGLKLEPAKVPQPVLAVVSVNEQPSPNSPDVAKGLPPLPPPAFEVSAIKLPCNGDRSMSPRFETGGRVTAMCMAVAGLIRNAWGLPLYGDIIGLPKHFTQGTADNISIAAKAPDGVAPDPPHNSQARDVLLQMLKTLLIERYKIQFHYEDRPMGAYTLVAAKPKLTRADPAGRTGCARQGQEQQGRVLMVRFACRNITMAQFAEQIQGYDSGSFTYPVVDGTGLEGAWDFTFNYDAMASLYEHFPEFAGRGAAANGEAAEPSGALTFAAALEKQLGLKLEVHKRPEPVLVIDHMEDKPTEN
jgi:uncharacterized protein (TIGR03435 family)